MKPISARQIAVVFTGSFLGAGFLSGQELLQFFGVFGGFGLVGMALAILAFVGFSRMVMAGLSSTTSSSIETSAGSGSLWRGASFSSFLT